MNLEYTATPEGEPHLAACWPVDSVLHDHYDEAQVLSIESEIPLWRASASRGLQGKGGNAVASPKEKYFTLELKIERAIWSLFVKYGVVPSVRAVRAELRCRQDRAIQVLQAFRAKYPGLDSACENCIYKFQLGSSYTPLALSETSVLTVTSSLGTNQTHHNSTFSKSDQDKLDSATCALYSLTTCGYHIHQLTFDVPSNTLVASTAVCHNSIAIVERLTSLIMPALNTRHWLCRWEKKSADHEHLHFFVAVPIGQEMPSENVFRLIWTTILPREAFLKATGEPYQPTQVHVDIQLQPILSDQWSRTYLAKKGPQARNYRVRDGVVLAPQERYHISSELIAVSDPVLVEKIPCCSQLECDQLLDELMVILPTPYKSWHKVISSYGPTGNLRGRYSPQDIASVKDLIAEFVQRERQAPLANEASNFLILDINPTGLVHLKKSHVTPVNAQRWNAQLSGVNSTETIANIQSDETTLGVPRTGLKLWVKGDFGPILSGSNITQWNDLSGTAPANNATQATGSKQATLVSPAINGYPSASFNGSSRNYVLANQLTDLTTGFSIFAVIKPVGTATKTLFASSNAGPSNLVSLETVNTQVRLNAYNATTASNVITPASSITVGKFQLVDAVHNGAASASISVNGESKISGTVQNLVNTARTQNILGANNTITTYWNGELAELLCYSRAVTETERKNIQAFLSNRYQLTTATATAAPVFSVGTSTLTEPTEVAIAVPYNGIAYFTLTGVNPTTSSPIYSGPLRINHTQTLKCLVVANGISSAITTANYTLNAAKWPAPDVSDNRPLQINLQLPTTAIPQ